MVGLSETLAAKVEPLEINVTVVEPNPCKAEISKRSLAFTGPARSGYNIAAGFERAGIADWATRDGDAARAEAAILAAIERALPPLHRVLGKVAPDAFTRHLRARLTGSEVDAALSLSADGPT